MDGSTQPQPIAPGQLWAIPKDGPWGGHYPPKTIIDVRDGWVRYGDEVFRDERMEEVAFLRIYRHVGEAPPAA